MQQQNGTKQAEQDKTTLRGYTYEQIIELMTKHLPQEAYKRRDDKSYLTSISAAYTLERLTKVFGLYGMGWGVDWDMDNTRHFETKTASGKARYNFVIEYAIFWFKFGDDVVRFPVTGHGDNDNIGDAMEGALTSAISKGAKRLLFQIHIYKG